MFFFFPLFFGVFWWFFYSPNKICFRLDKESKSLLGSTILHFDVPLNAALESLHIYFITSNNSQLNSPVYSSVSH